MSDDRATAYKIDTPNTRPLTVHLDRTFYDAVEAHRLALSTRSGRFVSKRDLVTAALQLLLAQPGAK